MTRPGRMGLALLVLSLRVPSWFLTGLVPVPKTWPTPGAGSIFRALHELIADEEPPGGDEAGSGIFRWTEDRAVPARIRFSRESAAAGIPASDQDAGRGAW